MAATKRIRGVLIDLSGTLHVGDTAIQGAAAALRRLRDGAGQAGGLAVRFVSNTTKEPAGALVARLRRLGFDVAPEEVYTSLTAAKAVIARRRLRPLLFLSDSACADVAGACDGAWADAGRDDNNSSSSSSSSMETAGDAALDSVVVGLAPDRFHYEALSRAFRVLSRPAAAAAAAAGGAAGGAAPTLLAVHKGRYYKPGADAPLALGPGPFVAGLEYAAGCTAEVVGKPSRAFFEEAARGLGLALDECAMVGDDARDDVGGAKAAGAGAGVLVQTGKYRAGDEDLAAAAGGAPDATVPDFGAAVDWILSAGGQQ